eukprot:scaffold9295_cov122-Isochrysis_galbana.AAC.6
MPPASALQHFSTSAHSRGGWAPAGAPMQYLSRCCVLCQPIWAYRPPHAVDHSWGGRGGLWMIG